MKNWICVLCCASLANAFLNVYPKLEQEKIVGDPGQPLILTPLIQQGKIKEARNASEVTHNSMKGVKSFSGFLTVNSNFNSNLFFWFFPSTGDFKKDPVVLWLQGGPGATSLFGLFTENGPFIVTRKHGLKLRKYSWTKGHSMLYIDNPVGTGFSFTNGGYARNETAVGADLYTALLQFFQLFPELQANDFFITGESYGGKYVPAISYTIYKNNPSAKQKINLKGLAIGNGLSDPEHQINYGDYLYQLGLIDINTLKQFKDLEQQGVKYIQNKQWKDALEIFDIMLNGDLHNSTVFRNATGFVNYFNYLVANNTDPHSDYMGKYVQREDIRMAIHVGNATFHVDQSVELNLAEDIVQSVVPWVSELLSHYPVLVYNGQLDIIVAYPLTVNYLQNMKFSASDEYKTAPRHIWRVGNDVAGYVKHAGNLTEVLVRNAGHMVPGDQPLWALDLITRFTRSKSFFD